MTKNQNVVAMLAARFPQTFVADSSRPHRPLKLGIDRDLVALGVLDEASAAKTLRHYCSRLMYRRSIVVGAVRLDLDGQAAGKVAAAHAAHAQRIITRLQGSRALEASDGAAEKTHQHPCKERVGLSELKAAALARRVAVPG
jgi:ProP effector